MNFFTKTKSYSIALVVLLFCFFSQTTISQTSLRRPISTVSPAWLIHIDVWVDADPKKIIEIIPEDIRPYVIFNISLSVSDPGSGPYGIKATTPTIAESWLRTCAEYGVWAVIQPASGYKCNLPYTHTANDIYERFFQEYPNFLGYNFCEQCWGFPNEAAIDERLSLFANLLQLGNKYGGYLFVSNTQTMNTPQANAVAFLKRSISLRSAAKAYTENFVILEKYTTSRGFYDVESTCLGMYLSGYCGNYGIRFDDCGWGYLSVRENTNFPESLGAIPVVEHLLLTGQTVTDGPELTWTMSIGADGTQISEDGYRSKKFKLFPNFENHNLDIFRKQLDGSFLIPTKEEVIERTKIVYVNDATSGDNRNRYSSEKSLFTGLYAVDGEYDDNNKWTKKTGRYPAIPTVFTEGIYETGSFEKVVKKSNYFATWPSLNAKIADFNNFFPEEYTGNIYAGRIKNTWITYNPYMGDIKGSAYEIKNSPASGTIPFKYNTCEKMEVSHSNYGYGVFKEYAGSLQVYLNNFCSKQSSYDVPLMRDTEIKIFGSTQQPTYTYNFRTDNGFSGSTIQYEKTVIADFESNNIGDTYTMTNANGKSAVVADPAGQSGKVLRIYGPAVQSFPVFTVSLPAGRKLSDYTRVILDFNGGDQTGRYGQGMRMAINDRPLTNYDSPAGFGCPNGSWGRGLISLPISNLNLTEAEKELTEFKLTVGSATGSGDYYIDNIVMEREAGYSQPVTDSWIGGVFTLTVNHNVPLDITINCSGDATGRSTDYPANPVMVIPAAPPVYKGLRQHEFEDFEYINIERSNAKNNSSEIEGYTGMSYSIFGNNPNAGMRKEIIVPEKGIYTIKTRYSAPVANVETVDLYVNYQKKATLLLDKTSAANVWNINETTIELEAGSNMIEFKANGVSNTLYLDNIVIENKGSGNRIPEIKNNHNQDSLFAVYEEYYNMVGQRIYNTKNTGLYIIKSFMSDGSTKVRKVFINQ